MPQRLHECLHDPNLDVAAIGPRPKGARLLMGMIVAAGLTLGALTPGQAQGAEPVPVASMPTRAAGAHWIELPRTIFLEVGKDADGRIFAGRLVAAW